MTETASGNTLTYTYNPAGQLNTLKRVQGTVTTTQTRTYDAVGMLAQVANVTGSTTSLDWDPTGGVAQLIGMTVGGTTGIVQGVTGLAGSKTGATQAAYGIDQYGSAITGTQARSTAYSAFGEAATAATFEPRLGYRGELTLDSLTYLRARDYQTSTGAFTSADPVQGRYGATTLNNRYHYVDNKPLQRTDPTGLFSVNEHKGIDGLAVGGPSIPPATAQVGQTLDLSQLAPVPGGQTASGGGTPVLGFVGPLATTGTGAVLAPAALPLAALGAFAYTLLHDPEQAGFSAGQESTSVALSPMAVGAIDSTNQQIMHRLSVMQTDRVAPGDLRSFSILIRYMSPAELDATLMSSAKDGSVKLRGGRPGTVFMTPDIYLYARDAQNRLSLPDAPSIGVAFLVAGRYPTSVVEPQAKDAFGPGRPSFDTSGGGNEVALSPTVGLPIYSWNFRRPV